jgi:hypothetical protein
MAVDKKLDFCLIQYVRRRTAIEEGGGGGMAVMEDKTAVGAAEQGTVV